MTAALAALDAPHEVMDDEATGERSKGILDAFLDKLGAVPRDELPATARDLMEEVRARLERERNPISRAVMAQNLIGVIDERAERERDIRDVHVGVLIWPWRTIQRKYAKVLEDLDERRERGEITEDERRRERERVLHEKRYHEVRTRWSPTPLANHAHISRGLVNSRIIPRVPDPVPQIPREEAEVVSERSGRIVKWIDGAVAKSSRGKRGDAGGRKHRTLRDAVEEVRNGAIDRMMAPPSEGGLGISNADVSRELGMKTARIAQLRTGH